MQVVALGQQTVNGNAGGQRFPGHEHYGCKAYWKDIPVVFHLFLLIEKISNPYYNIIYDKMFSKDGLVIPIC